MGGRVGNVLSIKGRDPSSSAGFDGASIDFGRTLLLARVTGHFGAFARMAREFGARARFGGCHFGFGNDFNGKVFRDGGNGNLVLFGADWHVVKPFLFEWFGALGRARGRDKGWAVGKAGGKLGRPGIAFFGCLPRLERSGRLASSP